MGEGTNTKCAGNCMGNHTCKQNKTEQCKDCTWRAPSGGLNIIASRQVQGGCYFGNEFRRFVPRKHTCGHWVSDCILDDTNITRRDFMKVMYKKERIL